MTDVQGQFEFADADLFMESHEWSLHDHPSRLSEQEFAIRETAQVFEIDLDGRKVAYRFASEKAQLALDIDVEGWTPEALVLWLDRQARDNDIAQQELLRWLSDLDGHLIRARAIHISALMRCKFILAGRIRTKIAEIRRKERKGLHRTSVRTGGQTGNLVRYGVPFRRRHLSGPAPLSRPLDTAKALPAVCACLRWCRRR